MSHASIFISDLDGTLLRPDSTLSSYSRTTLNRLLDDGILFSVASARSIVSMQRILQGLRLRLPVIEFNGAFITDFHTGEHQIIHDLDRGLAVQLLSLYREYGFAPMVSGYDGREDCVYYDHIRSEGMRMYYDELIHHKDPRLRHCPDLRTACSRHPVCFTLIDRKDALLPLTDMVKSQFADTLSLHLFEDQYAKGWYWLTVHDRKASKARAIRSIMEQYGLHRHTLTVFGDQLNDIPMFEVADHAVAVANAAPELKQLAAHTIGSNEEDSVVRYIENQQMIENQCG